MRVIPNEITWIWEKGKREGQEDSLWPDPVNSDKQSSVFVVCDGVGGSNNGGIASRIVATSLGKLLEAADVTNENFKDLIADAVSFAQDMLIKHMDVVDLGPTATTFAMVVFSQDRLYCSHIGDSRIYHIRNGGILFKTKDDSVVTALVDSGFLSEKEALRHPRRNLITKAVSNETAHVSPSFHVLENFRDGDKLFICSDGILEGISEQDLCEVLRTAGSAGDAIKIIRDWCETYAADNFSAILLNLVLTY